MQEKGKSYGKRRTIYIFIIRWENTDPGNEMDTGRLAHVSAILQVTHGMIEFVERYKLFAKYLTEHGFLVVGHDHLGHGGSVQSEEDWGYFAQMRTRAIR